MSRNKSDFIKTLPIYIAMLAPLVGIAFYAVQIGYVYHAKYQSAQALDNSLQRATHGSNLAHELQKERGMSAGFIGSEGAQFGPELAAQRQMTDAVIAKLGALLSAPSKDHATQEGLARDEARAQRIDTALGRLRDIRDGVDERTMRVAEVAGYYSAVIADLLSFPDDPLINGQLDEMARQSTIYHSLLLAKEFAGQERAIGSVGFGSGAFTIETLVRFDGLIQRQQFLFDRIRTLASPEELALLDAVLSSAAAQRIGDLRHIAEKSVGTAATEGISGTDWFQSSTAYLGELRAFEQDMAAMMTAHANEVAVAARNWSYAIAIGSLLFIAIIGAVGFRYIHRLIGGLIGLRNAIRRIERAEQGIEIPALDRKDMVGEISRSLLSIRDKGAEAARVEAAIDSAQTAFIIVDGNGNSLYENPAFSQIAERYATGFATLSPGSRAEGRAAAGLVELIEEAERNGNVIKKSFGEDAYEITVDSGIFESRLSPVVNGNGHEIGTALQITDVSDARSLENQVVEVLNAIQAGNLGTRIENIDDLGFTSVAAHGINQLMDAISVFMSELDVALSEMAEGDLTARIERQFAGDFATAASTFNGNLAGLVSMVEEVIATAESVKENAVPIADSARQLAARSEEQAAALEEVSATMEEISNTTTLSADNASEAANQAAQAANRAGRGREVLEETQAAMSKIEDNSSRIVDIVTTIDSIAFQTNLLALNAAVEAARAGEAGRGFVIVANEVRTLAGRAGDAANQIRDLISVNVKDVATGVELMERTKDALEQINEAVSGLSGSVGSIKHTSDEQAVGVREIASTISQLDSLTQHNASVADEGARSGSALMARAETLIESVSRFRTSRASRDLAA